MRIAHGPTFVGAFFILAACGFAGCGQSTPAPSSDVADKSLASQTQASEKPASETPVAHPPSPPPKSDLLNTSPKATYVGNQACIECHQERHESFLQTPHSFTLTDVKLDAQPPDAEFEHAPSGRVYKNFRKDGKLWHRESMRMKDGAQLVLGEYPVRYAIGSGNHSRSYIVEIDGFLIESPLTWFKSRGDWYLTPGFDKTHFGFSRPASRQCLSCHTGPIEAVEGSVHRLKFHQYAIGCERCHGPGSMHVERWKSDAPSNGEVDLTIVHPDRLSRPLQEALCDQCHLHSVATVAVRGRSKSDFRPGFLLQDFNVHYWLKNESHGMTVEGHSEQMRLSPCYQKSKTLTCLSCHDPHGKPAHELGPREFRQQCLSCHETEESCGLAKHERVKKSPEDNCVQCHMPHVETTVPHFAVTHHRIGIHEAPPKDGHQKAANDHQTIGELEPINDLSTLPPIDQQRCLGLAYVDLAGAAFQKNDKAAFNTYRERAEKILQEVYQQGVRDPEVQVGLAGLFSDKDPSRAVRFAELALRREEELSPDARANAYLILAGASLKSRNNQAAVQSLQRLVRLRRGFEDWLMLGVGRLRLGDAPGALTAFQQAAKISPARPDVHQLLGDLYQVTGNVALGRQHQQKAVMFSQRLSR